MQDGFDLYLHGFFVTDDGTLDGRPAGHERRFAPGAPLPLAFGRRARASSRSRTAPSTARRRATSSTSPTGARRRRARRSSILLAALGPDRIVGEYAALTRTPPEAPAQPELPHLVMPAHHDVRAERRVHPPPARHARRRRRARPGRLSRAAADAGRRRAHGAVARHGRRGRARRAVPLRRIRRASRWRMAARTATPIRCRSRSTTRRSACSRRRCRTPSSAATRSCRRLKRLDDQARQLERTASGPSLDAFIAGERARSPDLDGRSVFGWETDVVAKSKTRSA